MICKVNYRTFFFLFTLVSTLLCKTAFAVNHTNNSIHITDHTGRQIILSKPATRIISLSPHLTEVIFSVDAGDLIVGTVAYSNYPEKAKSIPQIGSYNAINFESALALKPDLVISWSSGNGPEIVEKFRALNIPIFVSDIHNLEDIAKLQGQIGVLTNRVKQANLAKQTFLSEYNQLKQTYKNKTPVTVFYQVWNEPLQTINGKHLISKIIDLCGGTNVFSDAQSIAPILSIEGLLAKNPEVIIASGMDKARPEWLDDWKAWPSLDAVKHNRLYFIPPDIIQRHSPRILLGAKMMCKQLDDARNSKSLMP